MSFFNAYYSLIQYCPDRGRAEAANVGALLICPELKFARARTTKNHNKVRKFFGRESFDPARLMLIQQAIEARVRERYDWSEGLADLERFVRTRANDLQLTPPRSMKTEDPSGDLDVIFREAVGTSAPKSRQSQPMAFQLLAERFKQPGLRERIQFDRKIDVPVLGTTLTVPYAFQNGNLNLVKTHHFATSQEAARKQAAELAVEGDLIQQEHTDHRLIVVPAFSESARDVEEPIHALFDRYEIRTIEEDEIEAFITEVNRDAH